MTTRTARACPSGGDATARELDLAPFADRLRETLPPGYRVGKPWRWIMGNSVSIHRDGNPSAYIALTLDTSERDVVRQIGEALIAAASHSDCPEKKT